MHRSMCVYVGGWVDGWVGGKFDVYRRNYLLI